MDLDSAVKDLKDGRIAVSSRNQYRSKVARLILFLFEFHTECINLDFIDLCQPIPDETSADPETMFLEKIRRALADNRNVCPIDFKQVDFRGSKEP